MGHPSLTRPHAGAAVLAMAGATLVVVKELMAAYLRNKAARPPPEPAISYRRLMVITPSGSCR